MAKPPFAMCRLAMRSTAIALAVLVAFAGIVAIAPAANAALAPPDIGNDGGCGYFHWHNGDVKRGVAPGYHYHHCM